MIKMIPKVIHYCWFGRNPKPELVNKCIDSWRRFLPDFEIKEWNEDNYDVNQNQYIRDAYAIKKWAFVSDFARLDILYRYGGIYLDIDVEFIKPLPDEYLNYKGFTGFEYTGVVNPGLIFGVEKGNELIGKVVDSYKNDRFKYEKSGIYKTINTRITEMLESDGLVRNGTHQVINGIHIFPSEYFCGYDTDIREPLITDKTICWHHYLGSWSNPSAKMKAQDALKKIIGKNNYKKLILLKRKIKKC